MEKKLKQLQQYLQRLMAKLNTTVSHNKSLRAEIDTLRHERNIFKTINMRLTKDFEKKV